MCTCVCTVCCLAACMLIFFSSKRLNASNQHVAATVVDMACILYTYDVHSDPY